MQGSSRLRSSPPRLAALLGLLLFAGPLCAASRPAARGIHGMVVSPDEHATRAGIEVLRGGGNAIDAAVTVSFVLAVTTPEAGNLGGGGFLLYRSEKRQHHALDFRETAPRALKPERFLDEDGRPVPGLSLDTGLAVGVPGSVAGTAEAHRRWGSREWRDLLQPAIRLAEEGFPVSARLARSFSKSGERLLRDEEARRIFTRDGVFPLEGELLIQPELAATLKLVAERGAGGFHEGPVAAAVAATVVERGGVMDARDLADYRPTLREPLMRRYRGYRVVTFPPPSSGGVALLQMLAMLEPFDIAGNGFGASTTVHHMVEAERRAYADRSRWLGDPDHYDVPTDRLLDAAYLARRAAGIEPQRATPSTQLGPGQPLAESPDTLHFSVADADGRAVSLTTTLNTSFGSGIVARGTGVLLNNEIDDFALAPGVPNTYGLVGGEANAVAPRKRPLSSMTPTIVELAEPGARPLLVLGSPGGGTIITSVLQVLVNVLDHEMPLQDAVDAPRFHHQWLPDAIRVEPWVFPADVKRNLEARGHSFDRVEKLGNVNAIGLDETGRWLGAADPRRQGLAAGH